MIERLARDGLKASLVRLRNHQPLKEKLCQEKVEPVKVQECEVAPQACHEVPVRGVEADEARYGAVGKRALVASGRLAVGERAEARAGRARDAAARHVL